MFKSVFTLFLAVLLALLSAYISPQANAASKDREQAKQILQSGTGQWQGQLYYLDYQSGRRFAIPMQVAASLTPDASTLVRHFTYTDPGILVHAIDLMTLDKDNGELVESYFREGAGDLFRYQIEAQSYTDAEHWQLTYTHQGMDDGKTADIKHTMQRDGDLMTSSKSIKFADQQDYILRNSTELKLVTNTQ